MAQEHPASEKAKLTQVAGNITGKLWCGYHQGYANASTGRYQDRNGKRWMCVNCMEIRGIASPAVIAVEENHA